MTLSFLYIIVLTTIKTRDRVISCVFTLNINGQIETIIPTEIWIKFLVECAGLFNRTLRSSAAPRMINIPISINPKSVQSVMINSHSSILVI